MQVTRTESVPNSVVYQTICDACEKSGVGGEPKGWLHFSSGHDDWGNDSIESWEDHDACSWACYLVIVAKVFGEYPRDERHATLVVDHKDWWFVRDMLAQAS